MAAGQRGLSPSPGTLLLSGPALSGGCRARPIAPPLPSNPHQARYWFDLAGAYQLLGNTEEQKAALERGLVADPTTPDLAWEAGNFYLVQGETDKALREFRVVMESDPYLPPAALKLCWRVKPDIDALLRDVVPPTPAVYSMFLDFLVSQKETAAAAKVWTQLVQLRQPLPASAGLHLHSLPGGTA